MKNFNFFQPFQLFQSFVKFIHNLFTVDNEYAPTAAILIRLIDDNAKYLKPDELHYLETNYGDYLVVSDGKIDSCIIPADFSVHHLVETIK